MPKAANTCTSKTGVVSGTDTNFVLTYKASAGEKLWLMIKYTIATSTNITITFEAINASLHATDKYKITYPTDDTTTKVLTITISAEGNYRIPLEKIASERTVIANIAITGTTEDAVIVANFVED